MPSNLSADNVETTEVSLSWTTGTADDGAEEIRVRREQLVDGSYWPPITAVTVGGSDTQATDRTAQPDREYRYCVQSVGEDGDVLDESATITVETSGPGLPSDQAPAQGWHVEITPSGAQPRSPPIAEPQLLPTINGFPKMRFESPPDETWQQDQYNDAGVEIWSNGIQQPLDVLEHRKFSTTSTSMEVRGGTGLDQRVVARSDSVEPVADFVQRLIADETDYTPVVDNSEQQIRENVLLQAADILAELQAAFETIPPDIPLEWDGDDLVPLQTVWVQEAEDAQGAANDITRADFSGGEGVKFSQDLNDIAITISPEYDVSSLDVYVFGEDIDREESTLLNLYYRNVNTDNIVAEFGLGDSPGWSSDSISGSYPAGDHFFQLAPSQVISGFGEADIDLVAIVDSRWSYSFPNSVTDGYFDGPELYPDAVRLALSVINTPLAVTETTLSATTVNDGTLPELALREDGDGYYLSETDVNETSITYNTLAAEVQARIALGRRDGLEPRDQTPRLGYEPQRLDSVELRADLDETPVLINRTFDDKLINILQQAMDVYDGGFEIRAGDPVEVHVSRIDGRPVDIDPAISDVSIDRQTEGAVDRAIVYAAAESVRRLPFAATVGEWSQLPFEDGRIVEGSETVYDGSTADEEPLDRGDDYELREVVADGPPEIKLLTSLSDPRIDCSFKPRGEHTAAGASAEPKEIVEDAPELNSKQMADLAAFQAVEGSYTDAVIDATVTLPPGEIGFEVLDALNVADLPGDEPYQIRDVDINESRIQVRLGAGQTAGEAIQEIRDKTGRVSERV